MSAQADLFVCDSAALLDGGTGVRFPVSAFGSAATGFAVRYQGKVYAYLNRCAHAPVELDWFKGEFFESGKLRAIAVSEAGDKVYWQPDQYIQAPAAQA